MRSQLETSSSVQIKRSNYYYFQAQQLSTAAALTTASVAASPGQGLGMARMVKRKQHLF
jgi:hypothetical protein